MNLEVDHRPGCQRTPVRLGSSAVLASHFSPVVLSKFAFARLDGVAFADRRQIAARVDVIKFVEGNADEVGDRPTTVDKIVG
jgi:hypothetical protein